jgi:ABC-2 type transport system ATP-binding protein
MPHAVELRAIRKTFGLKVAVEHLDLSIESGSMIGLIGPNGAGKTTAIRIIMSILFPDSGDVRVLGKESALESKDRIGYLPEERGLYKKMKVGDFLEYMARLKGVDGSAAGPRVWKWLERVGLPREARKRCEELSKGMSQKVQFIAAVIHEPDLLILDEPFSGLDPVNARLLRQLVNEEHRRGCTLIFSTHQMSQAENQCDRVVMIHQGKKVLDNTLEEIRGAYTPREVLFEPAGEWERAVAGMAGVEGIVHENGVCRAHLREGARGEEVLRGIAGAVALRRIELVRPSLEDVFVEIVMRNARSEAERTEIVALLRSQGVRGNDASGD